MRAALPEEISVFFGATVPQTAEDGSVTIPEADLRRGWWKMFAAATYPIMAKAAERLLSAHATTAATERNWSAWGHMYCNREFGYAQWPLVCHLRLDWRRLN